MMDQIGKFIASAVAMFLFMFSLIFCIDSPDRLAKILLVSANVLFWGASFGSSTGKEASDETDR